MRGGKWGGGGGKRQQAKREDETVFLFCGKWKGGGYKFPVIGKKKILILYSKIQISV